MHMWMNLILSFVFVLGMTVTNVFANPGVPVGGDHSTQSTVPANQLPDSDTSEIPSGTTAPDDGLEVIPPDEGNPPSPKPADDPFEITDPNDPDHVPSPYVDIWAEQEEKLRTPIPPPVDDDGHIPDPLKPGPDPVDEYEEDPKTIPVTPPSPGTPPSPKPDDDPFEITDPNDPDHVPSPYVDIWAEQEEKFGSN